MTGLFLTFAVTSLTISSVIILTFLLSRLFGTRFTANCRFKVWTVIIICLCLPLGTMIIRPLFTVRMTSESIVRTAELSVPGSFETGLVNDMPYSEQNNVIESDRIIPKTESNRTGAVFSPAAFIAVLSYIWFAGMIIYISFFLIRYGYYVRKIKNTLLSPQKEYSNHYKLICEKQSVTRAPLFQISSGIPVPVMYGFLHPSIVLPQMDLSTDVLECVLTHEIIHYKRKDVWLKMICVFARALHWFNPLVYLAAERCNSEMELSCDEAALYCAKDNERILYGKSLLYIMKHCKCQSDRLAAQFCQKYSSVQNRVINIFDRKKKKQVKS
ncbi:MAG: M56 family metallopeptidase [Clostridia bacterium]|nr:M56 family metallopeptidase [Clostridia bacterium]